MIGQLCIRDLSILTTATCSVYGDRRNHNWPRRGVSVWASLDLDHAQADAGTRMSFFLYFLLYHGTDQLLHGLLADTLECTP